MKPGPRIVAILACIASASCSAPAVRVDHKAQRWGFEKELVSGDRFDHVVYRSASDGAHDVLHVYLEGDGRAWKTRTRIARDPTSTRVLMLDLMRQDDAPSVYVGRPCYFGLAAAPPCSSDYWTSKRYAPDVVDSLAAVIRAELSRAGGTEIVLVGHSGGGTLATLLAARLPETRAVVTVAGNLDTEAWIRHHRYDPLTGSLNPATEPALPSSVTQWHLVGGQDINVPMNLTTRMAANRPDVQVITYPDYDHVCCWKKTWGEVLDRLAEHLTRENLSRE